MSFPGLEVWVFCLHLGRTSWPRCSNTLGASWGHVGVGLLTPWEEVVPPRVKRSGPRQVMLEWPDLPSSLNVPWGQCAPSFEELGVQLCKRCEEEEEQRWWSEASWAQALSADLEK